MNDCEQPKECDDDDPHRAAGRIEMKWNRVSEETGIIFD
jgi:hypothetical protein